MLVRHACLLFLFLSDGKPSDHIFGPRGGKTVEESILQRVEMLAKRFGRRLTFTTVGIGSSDDFHTLQDMADAAKDYGAIAEFQLPSSTSSSIGAAFSSVASSLATTQTEMTDVKTLKQQRVREDVERESRKKASKVITSVAPEDFHIYKPENVRRTT